MNKRKVLSILLLALITVTLAVSCSGNINTPVANSEELSYVTFGNGHSRELGTSYETEAYRNLYWFYTATKNDQYGTTGATTAEKPVTATYNDQGAITSISKDLSGRVGPFSQGKWTFTLKAYSALNGTSGSNLVYEGTTTNVILKGGEVKNVPVSVTTQGATGTLEVKDAYFEWNNNTNLELGPIGQGGGADKPLIKFSLINSSGVNVAEGSGTITFSDKDQNGKFNIANNTYIYTVPVGYYTGVVSVYLDGTATDEDATEINNEGTPVYTQSFGVRIYGNATTYISGNMVEGVNSKVTFDVPEQEMVIFTVEENGSKDLTVPITPDGVAESTTVVSFPSGALDTSAVHQLNVTVTPIASAEQKFQVSGIEQEDETSRTAVAGIDLTMVKVQKNADGSTEEVNVTDFNNQAVTITTYIATGLNSVEVKYLNDNNLYPIAGPITATTGCPSYDPETGKLVFSTTHFSQYVVVSPVEAINVNTGVPYTSLATAIDDAKDGQKVKLMKDVALKKNVLSRVNLTLDLAGKSIVPSDEMTGNLLYVMSGKLTIIDSVGNGKFDATKTIETDKIVQGCIVLWPSNNITASLQIDGGSYIGNEYAISGNGTQHGTEIVINSGDFRANNGTSIYHPQNGFITINGGTFVGTESAIEIRSGNLYIKNGTFTATSQDFSCNPNGSGTTTVGAAIAIAQHTTKKDISVEINGGTFTGFKALNESNPQANDPAPQVSLSVTGGTFNGKVSVADVRKFITGGRFSSDPSEYLATECQLGYHDSGYYEILPEGPEKNSDDTEWTVTPVNAQYTLDGAYGSIDGKTIIFAAGEYPRLELGRATKFAGSNTDYYIGGISVENKKTFNEFLSIKNNGSWSASAYYVRNISNLTLKAEEGTTVKINGLIASSGHVYGEVYDYVLDKAYTNGSAYYLIHNLKNVEFEGITFTSQVNICTSLGTTKIDGFTFKNCTFNINNTASGNQAIRYYNENNNGNVKNITVDKCTFNNCFQGVYTNQINGITVNDSSFNTTGHNAIAIQSSTHGAVNHQAVVITGNNFANIGDRIIRFGDVGAETQITIQNNTATNSGDSTGQVIKAQSLAEGITYSISGNSWGEGKTVANTEFKDPTSSQNQ